MSIRCGKIVKSKAATEAPQKKFKESQTRLVFQIGMTDWPVSNETAKAMSQLFKRKYKIVNVMRDPMKLEMPTFAGSWMRG